MSKINAKKYLKRIESLKYKIEQRQEELEELRLISSGIRGVDYSADRVQSTPDDTMANAIGGLYDKELEIMQLIGTYIKTKDTIINQIQSMEDARYIKILYERYVMLKPFTLIAYELNYEYKWLCRLHGDALAAFTEIINTNKHE